MNSLVFIVEDETHIRNLLAKYLERAGVSFICATNIIDALELFKHNKDLISYVALDGNLGGHSAMELPETIVLAQQIVRSGKFGGTVFAMSSKDDHNKLLQEVIGKNCEIIRKPGMNIKIDTIKEIIKRIQEKRQKT